MSDFDGICAGAIVKYKYPDTIMHPIDYGYPFPWDEIDKDDTVYMVDFSLEPFSEMEKLNSLCKLEFIDHHKTVIEELENKNCHIPGLRVNGIGACHLTWMYLFPDEKVPKSVFWLGKYDVWQLNEDIIDFQYGMNAVAEGYTVPGSNFWVKLFTGESEIQTIKNNGRIIRVYEEQRDKQRVRSCSFERTLFGKYFSLCCSTSGKTSSRLFDSVENRDKYDLLCWFSTMTNGKWKITLCTENPDIDAGEICKALGGGGHKAIGGVSNIEDLERFFSATIIL
jgi:oligoribonuclease NrnB/cAMP/cGMP phosphodiesterase (DHH superfamily)